MQMRSEGERLAAMSGRCKLTRPTPWQEIGGDRRPELRVNINGARGGGGDGSKEDDLARRVCIPALASGAREGPTRAERQAVQNLTRYRLTPARHPLAVACEPRCTPRDEFRFAVAPDLTVLGGITPSGTPPFAQGGLRGPCRSTARLPPTDADIAGCCHVLYCSPPPHTMCGSLMGC